MEVHDFFLILLTMLLAARMLGEAAARLGAPPVIGELAAGILLGPSLLGWVAPNDVIRLLAEIGIILLLFEVGLETDIMRLMKTGMKPIIVAAAGVLFPFLFGFAASFYLFEQSLLTALFIGGTLTATSIGITVRVLTDLGRNQSPEASIVLGAAVLDDVLGVVLLAFLYEFSVGGGVSLVSTGKVALFIALFMVLAPFAAKGMAEIIKRFDRVSQIPGLIPTTVVSLVLFFAWLAHAVGAPELLGGFAAGLALSRRFFFPHGRGHRHRPGFRAPHGRTDETHRPSVHADLLRHGGAVAQFSRDRLVLALHLAVLGGTVRAGACGQAAERIFHSREPLHAAYYRARYGAARRGRTHLRRAWARLGHLQQRGLCRHGDCDCAHHPAATVRNEVVLRALRPAPACRLSRAVAHRLWRHL